MDEILTNKFVERHLGIDAKSQVEILHSLGHHNLDDFIASVVPSEILDIEFEIIFPQYSNLTPQKYINLEPQIRALTNSVRNYKIQDWVMSSIFANHAISMIDALIINAISSQKASLSYNYNPIINFHEAQLIIKLN